MKRPSFLAACFLLPAVAIGLGAACETTTTTTTFTPITGIIIRSSTLVTGVGCGTGTDEVFRYVAFVAPAPVPGQDAAADAPADAQAPAPAVQYATVVDCFADGVLVNLSTATAQQFQVTILAFNEATWNAVGPELDPAVRDASGPPLEMLLATAEPQANWVTTCTATEQQQIQVLAVCGPLLPNGASSGDGGLPDAPPDAAAPVDAPVDAPRDAPASDAPADSATDASDASPDAPEDAPPDAQASDAPDAD